MSAKGLTVRTSTECTRQQETGSKKRDHVNAHQGQSRLSPNSGQSNQACNMPLSQLPIQMRKATSLSLACSINPFQTFRVIPSLCHQPAVKRMNVTAFMYPSHTRVRGMLNNTYKSDPPATGHHPSASLVGLHLCDALLLPTGHQHTLGLSRRINLELYWQTPSGPI